jgi:hypothetical protein
MTIPKERGDEAVEVDRKIRAIVAVHEGRGTRFRIATVWVQRLTGR